MSNPVVDVAGTGSGGGGVTVGVIVGVAVANGTQAQFVPMSMQAKPAGQSPPPQAGKSPHVAKQAHTAP